MSPGNTFFDITFGDYAFRLDRRTLTYSLTETKTGTAWADGLSFGWVEFEDRVTGGLSRYDFGQTTLVSLSEKAGAQGKQVLFGLDCLGVPIDLYVTCGQRELLLTVEANRDSRTHRVTEVCLLPGLCAVPDDGESHLVIPIREGAILRARDAPDEPRLLPIWQRYGLSMPFYGAVRGAGDRRAALGFLTDSAYATLWLARDAGAAGATLDVHYRRDPERRRLELRVLPLPGEDSIGIARAYREKLVETRQHVTLRRKARERPEVETLLGGAAITFPLSTRSARGGAGRYFPSFADVGEIARDLKNHLGIDRALCLFGDWDQGTPALPSPVLPAHAGAGGDSGMHQAADDLRALGFLAGARTTHDGLSSADTLAAARRLLPEIKRRYDLNAFFRDETTARLGDGEPGGFWDDMDRRMEMIALAHEYFPVFGSEGGMDWSALVCDFWEGIITDPYEPRPLGTTPVPLYAAVYHDSVVAYPLALRPLLPDCPRRFLRSLLSLSPPRYLLDKAAYFSEATGLREYVRRTYAVLAPLHRLSFPAFLTAHRFLTPDFTVEEARYSHGARVVINSGDLAYETDDLALPPLGFLVEHPGFLAHDALRVGPHTFPTRAWRTARPRDDKPLTESTDVERREFAV